MPHFEPEKWNTPIEKRNPHNCYAYALDLQSPKLTKECKRVKCKPRNSLKPQPGYYGGYPRIKDKSEFQYCKLFFTKDSVLFLLS